MSISYNREQIGEGIFYNTIINPVYKTNYISIRLVTPLSNDTAAKNAFLSQILSETNSEFTTVTALSRKLASLYGASLSSRISEIGDSQILALSSNSINDKYALNNEKISEEVATLLIKCLTSPYIFNGEFPADDFALKKQELIDEIEAEINDKRSFASSRSNEFIYENEPSAISELGTKEQAQALTSKECFDNYLSLLATAQIEISFVSATENANVKRIIADELSKINRSNILINATKISPAKSKVARISESYDVAQSKMIMAFKSDTENRFAAHLFSIVYGGAPFSRLFENVREKLSLCYYCSCGASTLKNVFKVQCGVEHENIEKAEAEILNQLEILKQGDIDDELISNSKLFLENMYKSGNDYPSMLSTLYFNESYRGTSLTNEDYINNINAVTRDDLVAVANSLTLDTVYLLTGKESL